MQIAAAAVCKLCTLQALQSCQQLRLVPAAVGASTAAGCCTAAWPLGASVLLQGLHLQAAKAHVQLCSCGQWCSQTVFKLLALLSVGWCSVYLQERQHAQHEREQLHRGSCSTT
jgi:hypothetical protein